MAELSLPSLVILWLAICGVLLRCVVCGKLPSAGLIPAYLAIFALVHFFGAAIFLLATYAHMDRALTEIGFRQSLLGLTAFAGGAILVEPIGRCIFKQSCSIAVSEKHERSLPTIYTVIAAVLYFCAWPIMATVPTLSAVMSSMFKLLIVGLALLALRAWQQRKHRMLGLSLAGALSLPVVTVLTQGFLGYGVVACLIILIVIGNFYRPRSHVIAAGFILVFVALSSYVTYMRDRAALREVVWGGAPAMERIEVLSRTIGSMEWFNPYSESHLNSIEIRLNQNNLVGAAVEYLAKDYNDFAYGATLGDAVLALVPRAVWPDRPVFAGSGDLVTQYTGIVFAEGTSIGVGQVMEFYINFGTPGVIFGFLLLGALVAAIDRAAAKHLEVGNLQSFAFWFMPGIALLNVAGSLVELTGSFAASMIAVVAVNKFLSRCFEMKRSFMAKNSGARLPA